MLQPQKTGVEGNFAPVMVKASFLSSSWAQFVLGLLLDFGQCEQGAGRAATVAGLSTQETLRG